MAKKTLGQATRKWSTIAAAGTTDIGASSTEFVEITGATTISSFGAATNKFRNLRFAGAPQIIHSATLLTPNGQTFTVDAGATASVASDETGNWRFLDYAPPQVKSLKMPAVQRPLEMIYDETFPFEQVGGRFNASFDNTQAFEDALDLGRKLIAGGRYRQTLLLPVGEGLISGPIVVDDVNAAGGPYSGYFTMRGHGRGRTTVVSEAISGNVLEIKSGYVEVEGIRFTSDGVNRSKTAGAGNGLHIATPSLSGIQTFAHLLFRDCDFMEQPNWAGWMERGELALFEDCSFQFSGGAGSGGGFKQPIGSGGMANTWRRCRALQNKGPAYDINSVQFVIMEFCEALHCDVTDSGGWLATITAPNGKIKHCDFENDAAEPLGYNNLVGLRLGTYGMAVEGGVWYGFIESAIAIFGNFCEVRNIRPSNFGLPYPMREGVLVSGSVRGCELWVQDVVGLNVTNRISPIVAQKLGHEYKQGAKRQICVNKFTVTSTTPFSLGDGGPDGISVINEAGGTETRMGELFCPCYEAVLQSNANITVPTTAEPNARVTLIFTQDATGGRVVNFNGAAWHHSWTDTGNTANKRKSITFQKLTNADFTTHWIEISQTPYV